MTALINNGKIEMQKVDAISVSNDNASVYSNYFIAKHCAMHILEISEENHSNMGYLYFASGKKHIYKKTVCILNSNAIKIHKKIIRRIIIKFIKGWVQPLARL
jgi:hypothetical protein